MRGLPTYATPTSSLALAAVVALMIGVAFALLFTWIPQWNFYLSLAMGFGVAEGMTRVVHAKRGADLQALGIAVCLGAMLLGRVFLAMRLGISWSEVNAFPKYVENALRLSISPDGIFAALTLLIPWYRFR